MQIRGPRGVLILAGLVVAVMYISNDNSDADPDAPRGDGKYRPVMARGDGHMHFLITRSLVFDRDVDFDNDLARFGDPWNQARTVTGRKNVMQQIGPSLVWAPVLGVAHGAAVVANVFGADIETHGYTMFHQRIVFATSVAFALLALVLGVRVAQRMVGGRWGPVYAGVAVLFGTSLTYYATYMPSYAHAMDAAASAGFFAYWFFTLGQTRWRRYVWLGVLLGAAAMVRIQDLGFGVVLAIELGVRARSAPREIPKLLARGAAVVAIAIAMHAPQLYVWKQFYGEWLTTPQGPGQMRYGHPMVLELLFSSRNGWLSTHPIAYLGVIGLIVGSIAGPRLGPHVRLVSASMLVAVAIQVYVNAVTYEWWSGASFGQRRMCSSTLINIVGVAVLLRSIHLWIRGRLAARYQHAIAALVLGWFVVWNMVWVHQLRDAKPAGRDNKAICCDDVPRPLRWIAQPVYDVVGNPFALPASAIYAIDHGVDLARWDRAVGTYALVPSVLGYIDGSYRRASQVWNQAGDGGKNWLLDGWGPPQRSGPRAWRWTTAKTATMLLPLLMPEPHRIAMPIAANVGPGAALDVTVWCNGARVATARVGASWQDVTFDTDGTVGDNEIAIVAEVAPYRIADATAAIAAHPKGVSVGVAVGPLRVGLPPLR
jgi:hypothetical protein